MNPRIRALGLWVYVYILNGRGLWAKILVVRFQRENLERIKLWIFVCDCIILDVLSAI